MTIKNWFRPKVPTKPKNGNGAGAAVVRSVEEDDEREHRERLRILCFQKAECRKDIAKLEAKNGIPTAVPKPDDDRPPGHHHMRLCL